MTHFVITGAYGLVGSNICKVLERDKDNKITKIKFDEIETISEPADYIIHAAGYGQPLKFTEDKIKTIEVNTAVTELLFNYLKHDGKYLFISSSEVYSGAPSPHKETYIGTTTPQHPRACYIEGKRCGEAIVMAHREQGVDAKIARLALAYGPGTKKGDTRVLNQFIEQALTTGEIRLKDEGLAWRTYVYIEDAVEMMMQVLLLGKEAVYNIGGESRLTIAKLAMEIGRLTNSQVLIPNESIDIGAPDDVKLCLNRITGEFPQFKLLTPLTIGLERTIEYQSALYGRN